MDRRRIAVLAVALLLTTAAFFLFDKLKSLVPSRYYVRFEIPITSRVSVDFYGTVVPTAFSLVFILCLVFLRKFSFRQYLSYFVPSLGLASIFSITSSGGIGFYYIAFALSVGFLTIPVVFYNGGIRGLIKDHDLERLELTKRNYLNALLIAFSYASLSVLVLDLTYAFYNALSSPEYISVGTYVGGMGLTDVAVLSGLFACLSVTFVSLCVMLVCEDARQR